MGRPGSFFPGVERNAGGLGASIGRPGSFLPGVEPNPGGFGALIGSLGCRRFGVLRISGGFGGASCFSPGARFIGVPVGLLSLPFQIGGPGSRPSGSASGAGCSGLIGSEGSRWPGVDSGAGSSEFGDEGAGCAGFSSSDGLVGARSGDCAGVRVGAGVGFGLGATFGTLGGVACAQTGASKPMQPATHIATAPTRRKARGEELVSGLNMMGSDRWFRLVTSAASNGHLATTANPSIEGVLKNLRELRLLLASTCAETRKSWALLGCTAGETPANPTKTSQSFQPPPSLKPPRGPVAARSGCDHSRAAEKPSDGNQ